MVFSVAAFRAFSRNLLLNRLDWFVYKCPRNEQYRLLFDIGLTSSFHHTYKS